MCVCVHVCLNVRTYVLTGVYITVDLSVMAKIPSPRAEDAMHACASVCRVVYCMLCIVVYCIMLSVVCSWFLLCIVVC